MWEQLANHPGTGAALIVLCAAMPEPRGGGDFDLDDNWHGPEREIPGEHNTSPGPMPEPYPAIAKRTIGRWAGDRIALVGDYAEDTDLPAEFEASQIYGRTYGETVSEVTDDPEDAAYSTFEGGKTRFMHFREVSPPEYRDVTDDVIAVIEHELRGQFEGSGWRHWNSDPSPAIRPDLIIGGE